MPWRRLCVRAYCHTVHPPKQVVEGFASPPRKKAQLLDGLSSISLSEGQQGRAQQAFKLMATLPAEGPAQWTSPGWLAQYLPHSAASLQARSAWGLHILLPLAIEAAGW